MRVIPILLALFVVAGCAPKDRHLRLARVAAERSNLEVTFDHLEDRLLANQARVRLWRELRQRHESVAAIACVSQEEHAVQMAARMLPERSGLHHAKVASASPSVAKPRVRTTSAVR